MNFQIIAVGMLTILMLLLFFGRFYEPKAKNISKLEVKYFEEIMKFIRNEKNDNDKESLKKKAYPYFKAIGLSEDKYDLKIENDLKL